MIKQKFKDFLRKTHFLTLTDRIVLFVDAVRYHRSNKQFLQRNPSFIAPPKRLSFDAYNHTSLEKYDLEGRIHSSLIVDSIQKYLQEESEKEVGSTDTSAMTALRVAEWGCGPARLIRHLTEIRGFERVELLGYDYNPETIYWCRKNFVDISFHKCHLEPPLSADSNTFDCIYALSVFTHLSEKMHYAWMDELFRVLKPGGILIFTTHGNNSSKRLLPEDARCYGEGQLVVKGGVSEGKKHFLAYHPAAYIENKLLKGKQILSHLESPEEYRLGQDVWIVRK